jgi:ABC-type enterobactin transport system permease subunit
MDRFLAPLCLVLCLALLVTAFALLSIDSPEPNVQLHRATAAGDDARREVLERDLVRRVWLRRALVATLFAAALALGIGAYRSVSGPA